MQVISHIIDLAVFSSLRILKSFQTLFTRRLLRAQDFHNEALREAVPAVVFVKESEFGEKLEVLAVKRAGVKPVKVVCREKIPAAGFLCQVHKLGGETLAFQASEDAGEVCADNHCRPDREVRRNGCAIGADLEPATINLRPKPIFPVAPQRVAQDDLVKTGNCYGLHWYTSLKKMCFCRAILDNNYPYPLYLYYIIIKVACQ